MRIKKILSVGMAAAFLWVGGAKASGVPSLTPHTFLYYNLDSISGNTVSDISGNGRHGTLDGSPTLSNIAVSGNALLLDGVDDRIRFPLFDVLPGEDVVLEAFIAPVADTRPNVGRIVIEISANNQNDFFDLEWDHLTKKATVGIGSGGIFQPQLTGGPELSSDRFHYIAAVKRGGQGGALELYVNGELVASTIMSLNYSVSGGRVDMGAGPDPTSGKLQGGIDELSILKGPTGSAPSPEEMKKRAVRFEAPKVKTVLLDIKPGSDPNSINLNSKGNVPAAIFSGGPDNIEASQVDASTVKLAGASSLRSALEDVNGDGRQDLVLHFDTETLGLTESSTSATLTGKLKDGTDIQGSDSVRIVGK